MWGYSQAAGYCELQGGDASHSLDGRLPSIHLSGLFISKLCLCGWYCCVAGGAYNWKEQPEDSPNTPPLCRLRGHGSALDIHYVGPLVWLLRWGQYIPHAFGQQPF